MKKRGRAWRTRIKKKKQHHPVNLSSDADLITLRKWMVRCGYQGDHLQPALFSDTGRGLMASQSVKVTDVIISIPKKLLITTETALESEIGEYLKSFPSKLTPLQTLCIFLMFEKAKHTKSPWQPYIRVLPKSYTTPPYFNDKELACLHMFLGVRAEQQIATVKSAYGKVRSLLDTIERDFAFCRGMLTYEDFRWAWFVINTRSVYMEQDACKHLKPDANVYAMAPFLDLLNHSPTVEVSAAYNRSTQCYEIRTLTPYKKYDQVFICYGPHDNTKLLLEYGFIVPNNPHNVVIFDIDDLVQCLNQQPKLQLSHSVLLEKKQQLFHSNRLTSDLSCSLDGLSWKLQTVLKVLCMDFNELNSWKRILTGEECSEQTERHSKQLAYYCINKQIKENQEFLQEASSLPNTEHTGLIISICKERQIILETLLKTLIGTT